jgi:hypothetical protein
LIRRWLKAGILEDGVVHPNDEGTPQSGSISVLSSNLYLPYVLDQWFERVVKCRLRGEAHLARYIDDFVICFQYRSDALACRRPCVVGWESSALLWCRPRPSLLNLVGPRSDTRTNGVESAQKPSTFWA